MLSMPMLDRASGMWRERTLNQGEAVVRGVPIFEDAHLKRSQVKDLTCCRANN